MSDPYEGDSVNPKVPGILGKNTSPDGVGVSGTATAAGGVGVSGTGANGVEGTSTGGSGILGIASEGGTGVSGSSDTGYGVSGSSTTSVAVRGDSYGPAQHLSPRPGPILLNLPPPKNTAIYGNNQGLGGDTAGVLGQNDAVGGYGVLGMSDKGHGVRGLNDFALGTASGSGTQPDRGTGVSGDSANGYGVWGASRKWRGVYGHSVSQAGVFGESQQWEGVHGVGHGGGAGVAGFNDAPLANAQPGVWGDSANGEGVHGVSHTPTAAAIAGVGAPGGLAGNFVGNVVVTGDITLTGMDCAEHFDVVTDAKVEPGTVMVIDESGYLKPCWREYDTAAAGVVSGAGNLRPGIILGNHDKAGRRLPIALVGRVYCKVDARSAPIRVGDLLTTSSHCGHAMKAIDSSKIPGAVVGKALEASQEGLGLIAILVALQ